MGIQIDGRIFKKRWHCNSEQVNTIILCGQTTISHIQAPSLGTNWFCYITGRQAGNTGKQNSIKVAPGLIVLTTQYWRRCKWIVCLIAIHHSMYSTWALGIILSAALLRRSKCTDKVSGALILIRMIKTKANDMSQSPIRCQGASSWT